MPRVDARVDADIDARVDAQIWMRNVDADGRGMPRQGSEVARVEQAAMGRQC